MNLGDMKVVEPEKINQTQQRYEKSKYYSVFHLTLR